MTEQQERKDGSEHIDLAGVSGPIDMETVRKIKELVQRYGKETLKEIVDDTAKAA